MSLSSIQTHASNLANNGNDPEVRELAALVRDLAQVLAQEVRDLKQVTTTLQHQVAHLQAAQR